MASAVSSTATLFQVVETLVEVEVTTVNLELSLEEATALLVVLNRVGGSHHSPRGLIYSIETNLADALYGNDRDQDDDPRYGEMSRQVDLVKRSIYFKD